VTYPDGSQSGNFNVAIVTPSTTTQQGSPQDAPYLTGNKSTTYWALTDTCGSADAGLDGNELIGTMTDDYFLSTGRHNNWAIPQGNSTYNASNVWGDAIGAYGYTTPPPEAPQNPLTTVAVQHDPWTLFVGTKTTGSGKAVRADTQQFYQDHGRHN
jgi:hypothetical protein